ncbi:hypothetical protein PSHT_12279 [Puccinia striiformis]|uniref:Uncharacterized protein n=1 Tax=Puccinia striiformis TaxID=27350 RepID=A0A2S4UXY5_9BASI|nr:hypothetical protein PSHT_12279 [Puccinia striiformis]
MPSDSQVLVTRLTKKATRGAPNFPIRHIPSNVKQFISQVPIKHRSVTQHDSFSPQTQELQTPHHVVHNLRHLPLGFCCLRLTCRDHNGGLSDAARTASSKMIQLKSSSTDPSSGVHPGGGRSTDPSSGATRGGRSSTDPCARC